MWGGYGTGKPAVPYAEARRDVGRHERSNRKNASRRVAIAVAEPDAVGKPGVVDFEAVCRVVSGQQHEVLVAAQLDFGDDRPAGVELGSDQAQVWAEPARE